MGENEKARFRGAAGRGLGSLRRFLENEGARARGGEEKMDGADLSAASQSRRVAPRLLRKVTDDLVIFPATSRPERKKMPIRGGIRRGLGTWSRVSQPVKNRDDEHSWIVVFETPRVSYPTYGILARGEQQTVFYSRLPRLFLFLFIFSIHGRRRDETRYPESFSSPFGSRFSDSLQLRILDLRIYERFVAIVESGESNRKRFGLGE